MATRANTFSWAGSAYATNPLTGGGNYDPRRPSLLPDTQEEDALVWEDVPKAMQTRLANIPEQIITKDTAYRNGVEVWRYFKRDVTEHTVRLQVFWPKIYFQKKTIKKPTLGGTEGSTTAATSCGCHRGGMTGHNGPVP